MSSLARWAPRANRVPTASERRRDGGLSRPDFLPAVGGGYAVACCTRGVAQFGSALRSGRRGRGFKSRHPDDEDVRELARETSEEEGVRGRQAEYPDDEKACEFARGPSAVPGPKRPVQPAGVDQSHGSVSTALTSTNPASICPAEIVGMLRFRPGVQRRSGVDVSTVDTDTPQSLDAAPYPTVKPPPTSQVFGRTAFCFAVTPDRPHCTSIGRHGTKVGCTAWGSGVRAVRTTHGQCLPPLVQWEPGTRPPAERLTLR